MFDLDSAISEWRRQMTAGGLKTTRVLDELEAHLRDDVEQQLRSGMDLDQSFHAAVERIGAATPLKEEFISASGTRQHFLRTGIIGLSLAVILNLLGVHAFGKASAVFLSDPWWSTWFPSYITWVVFIIIGAAGRWPRRQCIS